MKEPWHTPQLVVLHRGTPQETMLEGCKAIDVGSGPINEAASCTAAEGEACLACNLVIDS